LIPCCFVDQQSYFDETALFAAESFNDSFSRFIDYT
jgi:hypothetical protein